MWHMHWIIVCEHFHGAVGLIRTEQLAVDLAAYATEIGECTYRPVPLELAQAGEAVEADDEDVIRSTVKRGAGPFPDRRGRTMADEAGDLAR
jgi:hypothetical protein